jgi:hypothetical protein
VRCNHFQVWWRVEMRYLSLIQSLHSFNIPLLRTIAVEICPFSSSRSCNTPPACRQIFFKNGELDDEETAAVLSFEENSSLLLSHLVSSFVLFLMDYFKNHGSRPDHVIVANITVPSLNPSLGQNVKNVAVLLAALKFGRQTQANTRDKHNKSTVCFYPSNQHLF